MEKSKLTAALATLLAHVDAQTCHHENTHRGGVMWTICDDCGGRWADDAGGVPTHKDAPAVANAREVLAELEAASAKAEIEKPQSADYRQLRLEQILAEYHKGCSNTVAAGDGPESCPVCVVGMVRALEAYVRQRTAAMDELRRELLECLDDYAGSAFSDANARKINATSLELIGQAMAAAPSYRPLGRLRDALNKVSEI